jgi:two-component system response regulator MtrA
MAWLRKQIEENPSTPRYIQTIRGVGYKFVTEDD